MTKTPATRSTRRQSVTVAHEDIVEAIDSINETRHPVQPYLLESHTFANLLAARRRAAAKLYDDLDAEIGELQAELNGRLRRRAEAASIIAQCDAALAVGPTPLATQSPRLEEHKE